MGELDRLVEWKVLAEISRIVPATGRSFDRILAAMLLRADSRPPETYRSQARLAKEQISRARPEELAA